MTTPPEPAHPSLAGTRLAAHLGRLAAEFRGTDVERLARGTLAGPGARDVFAELGRRLTAVGHADADAYAWDRAHRALRVDQAVARFVRAGVTADRPGRVFRAAANAYSPPSGRKAAEDHDSFWHGLRSEARADLSAGAGGPAGRLADDELHRSLRRLAYREQDAEDARTGRNGHVEAYQRDADDFVVQYAGSGLFRSIASLFSSPKPAARSQYDGVVHTGAADRRGNLSGDKLPLAMAERSAVAHALQSLKFPTADAGEFAKKVHEYVNHVGRVVDALPDHPLVRAYKGVAAKLAAPEVYQDPQVFDPHSTQREGKYLTVPPPGAATTRDLHGPMLDLVREVVKHRPADMALAADGFRKEREHAALLDRARDAEYAEKTAAPPTDSPAHAALSDEFDRHFFSPAIKPAVDAPIKLAPQRGEKGKGGLRHRFIDEQRAAGRTDAEIRDLLQHEFFLTRREAAATLWGHALARRPKRSVVGDPVGGAAGSHAAEYAAALNDR